MPLTAEQVRRARAAALEAGYPRFHAIVQEICEEMGVKPSEVRGFHKSPLVKAARLQVYLCAREAGFSYPVIGKLMGNRNHTTILDAVQRANCLPNHENSTKIKAGRNAASTAPDPNRNRDTLEVRDNG